MIASSAFAAGPFFWTTVEAATEAAGGTKVLIRDFTQVTPFIQSYVTCLDDDFIVIARRRVGSSWVLQSINPAYTDTTLAMGLAGSTIAVFGKYDVLTVKAVNTSLSEINILSYTER